jgi:trimethylamine:corrinoid methyltransferase-like protein
MQVLKKDELSLIHDTSVEILTDTGVRFNSHKVLEIFKQHGFKMMAHGFSSLKMT